MMLTGAASVEVLDESEIEQYRPWLARPLDINLASATRLLSCGLFTRFQAVSILDYRQRHGDILSGAELALVDGFSEAVVRGLSPFLSFYSKSLPGETRVGMRGTGEATGRVGLRSDDCQSYGIKAKAAFGREEVFFSLKKPFTDRLAPPSFCYAHSGRKRLGKMVLGSFQARFGQGLALWSGFSMSGLQTPSAAYRRPSGLSPSWAADALKGVAADWTFGRTVLSVFSGVTPSMLPGANLTWYGKHFQCGTTAYYSAGTGTGLVSVDVRMCLRGTELFAEAASSGGCPAFLAGVFWPMGESRASCVVRWYPAAFSGPLSGPLRSGSKTRDEMGLSLGWEKGGKSFLTDYCMHPEAGKRQLLARLSYPVDLGKGNALQIRVSGKWKRADPQWRANARIDYIRERGCRKTTWRSEAVYCRSVGLLTYWEEGWKGEQAAVFLRGTLFRTDHWDDRIYVYERDAPGNFNVPAYYGRGYALSAVGSYRKRVGPVRVRSDVRVAWKDYPWSRRAQLQQKPGRAELLLQLQVSW